MINILLAEDHHLIREGFTHILANKPSMVIAYETDDALDATNNYTLVKPDVVLMDIEFGKNPKPEKCMNGLDALNAIIKMDPDAAVVVYSVHEEISIISEVYKLGAKSFVPKNSDPKLLLTAIETVATGKTYFLPDIAERLAHYSTKTIRESFLIESLDKEEMQIFLLMLDGRSRNDISECLKKSPKTISEYTRNIKIKLGADSIVDLLRIAIRHKLIEP